MYLLSINENNTGILVIKSLSPALLGFQEEKNYFFIHDYLHVVKKSDLKHN